MAYKIETKGESKKFFITNTITGESQPYLNSKILIWKNVNGLIEIIQGDGQDSRKPVHFMPALGRPYTDFVDANGDPFASADEIELWGANNVGFNSAGGSASSTALEAKLEKGTYTGTAEDLKDDIDLIAFEGVKTYQDYDALDAVDPMPSAGTTAKVSNDSDDSKNGYYSVVGSAWVKDGHEERNTEIRNQFEPSKNLIDASEIVRGYFGNTGVITASVNTIRSGYTPVSASTEYTLSGLGALGAIKRIVYFNSSKVFISAVDYSGSIANVTFTTPALTAFVGVNIRTISSISDDEINSFKASVQLEEGGSATSFVTYSQKLKNEALPENTALKTPIKIVGISSTSFEVHSLTESGEYLVHAFEKSVRAPYSEDAWYSPTIKHNGNLIIQGSFNWINMTNFSNEGEHVGVGHGCINTDNVKWFYDGLEFSPSDIVGETILAREFTFNWVDTMYAADSASTLDGVEVVAQTPLVESTRHILSGSISGFNQLNTRHKLLILRDGTEFQKCYTAMLSGYYPYFNRVQYENIENTINTMSEADGTDALSPSTAVISGIFFNTGDGRRAELAHVASMWGTNHGYKVEQKVFNIKNSEQSKMYIQATEDLTDFRKKLYWHPIITTDIESRAGVDADVFNNGDVIECYIERKITY
jgi:hypothetical protein